MPIRVDAAYPMPDDLDEMKPTDKKLEALAGKKSSDGGAGASWAGGCNPANGYRDVGWEVGTVEEAVQIHRRLREADVPGLKIRVLDVE